MIPPPLEENELVPALRRGDAETALSHAHQAWRVMEDPDGLPPLYYALTPEVQNRFTPEEQDRIVNTLIAAHGRRFENRSILLTHLAAYGSADRFIEEALAIAEILESQGRYLNQESFFLTTTQREQDHWSGYGPTADSCPLIMHVYYSYMGAPEGSVQMQQAERKFAFLMNPYLGSLIFDPEAEAFIREQGVPASGSFASRLARANERHEMDVVQSYIDAMSPRIEQMRRMTTDTERWAQEADYEERNLAYNVDLRRQTRPGARFEPSRWDYYRHFRVDVNVECSVRTPTVPYMTGYDLDIRHDLAPLEHPALYEELARANLDERYAPRVQRLIRTMRAVESFDQSGFDYFTEGWRSTYRERARTAAYLARLEDIERREREFYARQAREANEPGLLEEFFGGMADGLGALAEGLAQAQAYDQNYGQSSYGQSGGNYSYPGNYQTGLSNATRPSYSGSPGAGCDFQCTPGNDADCERQVAAYEQCLSRANSQSNAIFTNTYGRASGDRTNTAAPN